MGQMGAVRTGIAKDRGRWRTLAEGYFLLLKDTAQKRKKGQNGFKTVKTLNFHMRRDNRHIHAACQSL